MDRASNRIMMDLLKGKISLAASKKALANPKAHVLAKTMVDDNKNYRYWGKIKTARMTLAFCWSCHRNTSGYFLGWREVYEKDGKIRRDNYIARKSKKRLKLLQQRRTDVLIEKGAIKI